MVRFLSGLIIFSLLLIALYLNFKGVFPVMLDNMINKGNLKSNDLIEVNKLFLSADKNLKLDKVEVSALEKINKKISINLPLILKKENFGELSRDGIIYFTNLKRRDFNLTPLKENEKLNKMAEFKIDDMVKNQYFGHQLSNNQKLTDLATKFDYKFLIVGENLAKGYFEDDKYLVDAWFNSPGHRENILNKKYQEIGVAVKKALFEGEEIWLAVQHFGTSLSYCPEISVDLKEKIERGQKNLELLNNLIKNRLDQMSLFKEVNFNFVNDYNKLVNLYNENLVDLRKDIEKYNQQIELFNNCLKNFLD